MTRDELKKQLGRYLDLKAERGQILAEYNALADPRGTNLDGMPRGQGAGDPMVGLTEKRQAVLKKYEAKLAELDAALLWIEDLIDGLEPGERRLMRYRYIKGLTWEKVCVAIGYSWGQTHNIHNGILDRLIEKIGEKVTP